MASAERRNDLIGAGLIGLMALQFGTVVILGKIATKPGGLPITSMLAFRYALSAVLLVIVLAVLRQSLVAARGEGWRLAALGMAGYAVESGFFFAALRHGTAAAVTLLFFTYPVVVSAIGLATGKGAPGWMLGSALATAVGGAAIVAVVGQGVDVDGLGVTFALSSALTYSFYLAGTDAVLRRTASLTVALWVSAAAAVGLAIAAAVSGTFSWPRGLHQWGPVLGMGVFTAGAFVCLFAGLRRLGALRMAILSATEPLSAAILAAIFLGERIGAGTAVGGLLILAGAITASVARGEERAEPPGP